MRRLCAVLLLLLIGALAPSAAQAASCLDTMPITEVRAESDDADGFAATGLTVARGNTADPFDVTVLGVLDDGVAPGVDMIIVEVDSPAIDRAGGIWAGMSGSPVYEIGGDERLIGAVAYGLSFGPSKIGGLAVADDMAKILDRPVAMAQQLRRVPAGLRAKMVATGAVTARQAAAGFQRLPIPLGVSGLNSGRLKAFADRLPGADRFAPFAAGAAPPAPGDPAEIFPGSNFAAALSYGQVSAIGVGTTTAVCDDQAVAFGHPFNFDGPTALSVHTADAIVIQDDPVAVPFKLANFGGTVGTLDQDRLAGIRGVFGDAPDPIDVTSKVNDADETETFINRTLDSPDIAAFHLLSDIDRVHDRIGPGRGVVTWKLTGSAGGKSFELTRANKYADRFDFSILPADDLFLHLITVIDNPFLDVRFDSLEMTSTTQDDYRAYRIAGVDQRVGNTWKPIDPEGSSLNVQPGALLRLRVRLELDRSTTAVAPVEVSFRVPADAGGSEGSLEIMGGSGGGGGEEGLDVEASGEPKTFAELIAALGKAPRNDDLVSSLQFFGGEGGGSSSAPATVTKRLAEVVSGGLSVSVMVEGGEEPCGEVEPCEPEPSGPTVNLGGKKKTFKLGPAVRRGLKLTLRTSEAGRATLKAFVDRKTAKRLKLKKNPKGPVVVAAAVKRVKQGRNTVKLVFTKKARNRLPHAKRVKLAVRATIRSVEGNRATDRFNLTLKRKLR